MNWQEAYPKFAEQEARYLADVLSHQIKPENYESKGYETYGDEWTWEDEVRDAFECLSKTINSLDFMHREFPEYKVVDK